MPKNSEERDKLLQELAYLEQAEYIDKQIYAQLVEIVEQHFSEPDTEAEGVEEHPDGEIAGLTERYADLLLTKTQDEPLDFRRVFKKCINEVLKLYHQRLINTQAEQSGEVDGELIEWLKEQLNQYAFLQLSHPHLVKVPTEDDQKKFLRLMQLLQQKRVVSREWIEKELNAHLRLEDEALRDYVHVIADIIVEIFTAFGIEVVKK